MICNFKKSELKNIDFFDNLEKRLPIDVLYYIYTFCDQNNRDQIKKFLILKYRFQFLISFSILSTIIYFLGYLITNQFLGIFILLNIFLGYLILSVFMLILIIFCSPFKFFDDFVRL